MHKIAFSRNAFLALTQHENMEKRSRQRKANNNKLQNIPIHLCNHSVYKLFQNEQVTLPNLISFTYMFTVFFVHFLLFLISFYFCVRFRVLCVCYMCNANKSNKFNNSNNNNLKDNNKINGKIQCTMYI